MEVKQGFLFVVALCVITAHQTRSVDIDERRAAQTMRIMKQIRGYLNLGRDTSLDEVIQHAVLKLKADTNARRKKVWMKKMMSNPKISYPF